MILFLSLKNPQNIMYFFVKYLRLLYHVLGFLALLDRVRFSRSSCLKQLLVLANWYKCVEQLIITRCLFICFIIQDICSPSCWCKQSVSSVKYKTISAIISDCVFSGSLVPGFCPPFSQLQPPYATCVSGSYKMLERRRCYTSFILLMLCHVFPDVTFSSKRAKTDKNTFNQSIQYNQILTLGWRKTEVLCYTVWYSTFKFELQFEVLMLDFTVCLRLSITHFPPTHFLLYAL